ncbi:MAG: calcium/sodium antiporter [bacterium]|nr:calcium/sodium antiporter [bacterium]
MDWMYILLVALGFFALVGGGELLVRGASHLAVRLGISPLVIGLTVVAYGTSAPELAVGVAAGLKGSSDLALANVVGSNLFNTLLILGLCGLIAPLVIKTQLVKLDVPVMIGVSLLVAGIAWNGQISALEGALLFGLAVAYTVWLLRHSKAHPEDADEFAELAAPPTNWFERGLSGQLLLIAGGAVALSFGSDWLVEGATGIARAFGVSEVVIGLTLVAAGTSLPELMTSLMATFKGERDLAVGNVVGSNIFNLLMILGISSMITPGGLGVDPNILEFDLPILLLATLACLPIFITGKVISRFEGALFFGGYLAYLSVLVWRTLG